jgi:hypothetical protein
MSYCRDVALTEMHSTFLRDPLAVFLRVIEHARAPLTFENIRARLVHSGLSEPSVTAQWARYERTIKDDVHITYTPETRTYAWGRAVTLPDATEAVQRLASGKAQLNPDRQVLGDIVLAALSALATFEARPKPRPVVREDNGQAESQRQRILEERLKAESARAYAKVAAELEELIASGASARTLLQRIHAGAKAYGLRPIETAGATIRFDRLRHEPVVASTRDGSEVLVIRPGYVWQAGDEEVLVAKAVVIEQ